MSAEWVGPTLVVLILAAVFAVGVLVGHAIALDTTCRKLLEKKPVEINLGPGAVMRTNVPAEELKWPTMKLGTPDELGR